VSTGLSVVWCSTTSCRWVRRTTTVGRRRELNDACFVVRDANGQQLAYVYFENEPGRRSAAKLLSKDEARRIAANIAKLPRLVRKE